MASFSTDSIVPDDYNDSVFVNCPFDDKYLDLLRPVLFTVVYFGHKPRIASESSDSGENRLAKICNLISSCRYSIHDISRLKAKRRDEFARMNMPFELGIDFGTRLHGPAHASEKKFLVLEEKAHDFKIALSDLSGIDVKAHGNEPVDACWAVRDWYYETVGIDESWPEERHWASTVWSAFNEFVASLFDVRSQAGLSDSEATKSVEKMPMVEFIDRASDWISEGRYEDT